MPRLDRRAFLGSSLAGLAAFSSGHSPSSLALSSPPTPPAPTVPRAPDGLFLTWQRDPTTTATVQWVGPSVPDCVVSYTLHADHGGWRVLRVTQKPFPGTDLKVFRAELTGLVSNSEYRFRIGDHPAAYRFRTMPARATEPVTFVSGGDCGVNPHAVASNLLAAKQEPHFALLGGDLAYDNGRSPATFLAFLRNYSTQMIDPTGRLIPLVACLGNHELDGGRGSGREAASSFLSVFDGLFRDTTYAALDFGD